MTARFARPAVWRIAGLLLACASLFVAAGPAEALQGFGISPTSQTISLLPGQTTTGQLTVINDGDTSINYQIYATDYRVSGEDYKGNFVNTGSGPDLSAVSWFVLPQGTFTVGPRQQSSFNYLVRVPKGAAIGGHYAAIFVQTVAPPATGTYISRIERLGVIFYMAIGGNLTQSGGLSSFQLPWLQFTSPVVNNFAIRNSGNVHFLAQAQSQLYTPFGRVGTPVQTEGEVLPDTTRRFNMALKTGSPIGLYKVKTTISYLGQTKVETGWTLLIPEMTLIIVLISVALIVVGLIWLAIRRRRSKRQSN
jgi:hypothetical protein